MQSNPLLFRASQALCLGLAIGPLAASAAEPPAKPSWQWELTPYIWLPSLSGSVRSPSGREFPEGGATADFDQLVPRLEGIPFLGAVELRRERFGLVADLVSVGLGSDVDAPFDRAYTGGDVSLRGTLASLIGLYRAVDTGPHALDLGLGMRVSMVDTDLQLDAGTRPAVEGSFDWVLVDIVAAARYRVRLGSSWTATFAGDIGGGDSTLIAQATATADWQALDSLTLRFGWRYLTLDQKTERDGSADLTLSGPVLAASFRF